MIPFTLRSGKPARIQSTNLERVTIESPESSPPGSTVGGRIEGVACEFQMKVQKCRRVGDGFVLDGRVQNATRELRARLLEAAAFRSEGEAPSPPSHDRERSHSE